jgi:cell division septum initiation protein DivIVA
VNGRGGPVGVKELISENQELKQVIEELRREIAALKAK